jgi:predicted transcriptional regulator
MNVKPCSIEVDAGTAELLEARATARGLSISELLADIACNQEALPANLAEMRVKGEGPWSSEALEEDAGRLAEFQRARMGAPWDEVKAWMDSWGTPNELSPPQPRKL